MKPPSDASSNRTWMIITNRELIFRWERSHLSRERLSPQKWDQSWRFPRSADCTAATNDGPPEMLTFSIEVWRRTPARSSTPSQRSNHELQSSDSVSTPACTYPFYFIEIEFSVGTVAQCSFAASSKQTLCRTFYDDSISNYVKDVLREPRGLQVTGPPKASASKCCR
jgi:hypothetical protein